MEPLNVRFYTFSKKNNSTKVPVGNWTQLTCDLKDDCNMLSPILRIRNAAIDKTWNYCEIPDFRRYYFITDMRWVGACWEISCTVDALASWKTQLGAQSMYVLRRDSTTDFDPMITDTIYPATNEIELEQYAIPSVFVNDIASGIYVVGIISGNAANTVGAISYYAMSAAEFGQLKNALLSDSNLITMGIAEYDAGAGELAPLITDMSLELLKAMYNPYQYIASCMWFPIPKSAISSTAVSTIKIGWWEYSLSGNLITAQSIDLTQGPTYIHQHPQAATRGDYLNYAPYTKCTVFGIFGTTPLDLSYFDRDDDTLSLDYIIDLITGQSRVRFYSYKSSEQSPHHHYICEKDFLCGVPVQLAQIATDYLGATVAAFDATANTIQNAVSLNIGGAISSAAHGIYNTVNASMPQLSTSGTNGSFMIINSKMMTTFSYQFYKIVDEDIGHKGRPLCAIRQLNTLSGYVLCADGDFDIACTEEERRMISGYLTSGFFWE